MKKILFSTLFVLTMVQGQAFADMSDELNSEVNSFQVQLMPAKKYYKMKKQKTVAKKAPVKKHKLVAQSSVTPYQPVVSNSEPTRHHREEISSEEFGSTLSYTEKSNVRKSKDGFFQKITLMPLFIVSFYDGADDTIVTPRGMGDALQSNFSGVASVDLNLFNDENIVIETGVAYLQFGAQTGFKPNNDLLNSASLYQNNYNPYLASSQGSNAIFDDLLKTSYLGLNLDAKWLASGRNASTFYARAGLSPLFLMNKEYKSSSILLTEKRFGTISSFDLAANLGVGYSLKITEDIHVLLDITGYQGFIPVMSNYSIYNAGITSGLGISYKL